jgi:hypothetical protein
MNHLIARIVAAFVALPSLAAAQEGAVVQAPAPATDAAKDDPFDVPTDGAAAAGSSPSRLEIRLGGMPRVHAGLGTAVFRHRDRGFALFTADRWTTGVTAAAGVDLFRFGQRWLLSADADWSREARRSLGLFGGFGTSTFNAHTFGLGASLRYEALDWCQPYVHAWGGLAATRARFAVPSIGYRSSDSRQYLPAFGASLGATVWGPVVGRQQGEYRRYLSLGLRAEAGYELTGAFQLEYDLRGSGTYPIAAYEPVAGTLRLDAPYLRILVMLGAV